MGRPQIINYDAVDMVIHELDLMQRNYEVSDNNDDNDDNNDNDEKMNTKDISLFIETINKIRKWLRRHKDYSASSSGSDNDHYSSSFEFTTTKLNAHQISAMHLDSNFSLQQHNNASNGCHSQGNDDDHYFRNPDHYHALYLRKGCGEKMKYAKTVDYTQNLFKNLKGKSE